MTSQAGDEDGYPDIPELGSELEPEEHEDAKYDLPPEFCERHLIGRRLAAKNGHVELNR